MTLNRSENMGRIRSRDTGPEVILRKTLWASGLRYRTNFRTPGGRADIAIPGRQLAVFVDGCFWHGCPEHYVRPRSSKDFWDRKLTENVERDSRQTKRLLDAGWTVVRVWEHELREVPAETAARVLKQLNAGTSSWPPWRVVRVEFLDREGQRERRFLGALLGDGERVEEGERVTAKVGRVRRDAISRE